jgi:hypothetical protein
MHLCRTYVLCGYLLSSLTLGHDADGYHLKEEQTIRIMVPALPIFSSHLHSDP